MPEKSSAKKTYIDKSLLKESISLLEWDTLKTHLSSFASTEMGKRAFLCFEIPSEFEVSKRLLSETTELNEFESTTDNLISFSGVFDIIANVEMCIILICLTVVELASISVCCRN